MYYYFESAKIGDYYKNLIGRPVIASSEQEALEAYRFAATLECGYDDDDWKEFDTRLANYGTYTVEIHHECAPWEVLFKSDNEFLAKRFYDCLVPFEDECDSWYALIAPDGEDISY